MSQEPEQQPDRLADRLEREADELGGHSDALEERVMEVRREWDRKRADPKVPGAPPDDNEIEPDEDRESGENKPPIDQDERDR
jgi:hypothetical protein